MESGKPVLLPHVTEAMLYPEFWMTRKAFPHSPAVFYEHRKPEAEIAVYRETVKERLDAELFDAAGEGIPPELLKKSLNCLKTANRFQGGLIVKPSDLKFLPQTEPLLTNPLAPEIDRNQLSGLELGDECIIFAGSLGGGWCAVVTGRGTGWIKKTAVALGTDPEINYFRNKAPRITVIDPVSKVRLKSEEVVLSMGVSFPVKNFFNSEAIIPWRNHDGRLFFSIGVIEGNIVLNNLSFNSDNLLRQAFKYLGFPYVWGDHNALGSGIDCSRLVQNVLKTLGIDCPRNSQEQLSAGLKKISFKNLKEKERKSILKLLPPGNLLYTNSHVLIYLGEFMDRFYAIHALYSYHTPAEGGEVEKFVKQVVVSDLSLGEGTAGGSLLQRLTGIVRLFYIE
ncbi:MAG: C40 family peptidase [Bacillota bacterium]